MVTSAPNTCPNCHSVPVDGDRFCTECGWCLFFLQPSRTVAGRHLLGGRYEIIREAGRGTHSTVALARDGEDGFVAIKQLKVGPEPRRRIMEQESLTRTLTHENILSRLRLWTAEENTLAVMPWVEGASLRDLIDSDGTLTAGEVVWIAQCVATALSASHSLGIVHRSVRPSNILIDLAGNPLLCDFGMSHGTDVTAVGDSALASNASLYVAPEQERGEAVPASDQYSLGMVCYEMLGGRAAIGATDGEATASSGRDTAPTIGRAGASLPHGLEVVVLRMLSARAEDRWRSAAELSAALAVIPVVPVERAREQLVERIARVRHRRVVQEMLRAVGPASMQVAMPLRAPTLETGATSSLLDDEADTKPVGQHSARWHASQWMLIGVVVAAALFIALVAWVGLQRR